MCWPGSHFVCHTLCSPGCVCLTFQATAIDVKAHERWPLSGLTAGATGKALGSPRRCWLAPRLPTSVLGSGFPPACGPHHLSAHLVLYLFPGRRLASLRSKAAAPRCPSPAWPFPSLHAAELFPLLPWQVVLPIPRFKTTLPAPCFSPAPSPTASLVWLPISQERSTLVVTSLELSFCLL